MIGVDAQDTATRARRRTWMLGGVLLAASALVGLWLWNFLGIFLGRLPDLLFAAGVVVFALGIGRAGSVTGRRPFGTIALIALAAWLVMSPLLGLITAPLFGDGTAGGEAVFIAIVVSTSIPVVSLILAVIAVVQIGRAGVVPRPWCWAPLWALLAVIGVQVVQSLAGVSGLITGQPALIALYGVGGLVQAAAVAFLGVLAIVLATRPAPGDTALDAPSA